jgi:tRNA (guanine-N7-)-methyltransferase
VNNRTVRPEYAGVLVERRESLRASLQAIFADPARPRFVFEVGCGHGHFLAAYAAAHPEKTCIGVDIASDRIERAVRKRDRAKLMNLHFIRADAGLFIEALPIHARIGEVFILFPDPWPKSRHHKHRVLQPTFIDAIANHAAPACRLYFRTDHPPYFAQAKAVVSASSRWQHLDEAWPFEYETVFQSRAEQHESFVATLRSASA